MFIKKLQAFNYKSYLDSSLMEFTPGINIIIGRNNAGKTSLLELLTLKFENQPHKSLKTLPTKSSLIKEESKIQFSLSIEKQELRTFFKHIQSPVGMLNPGIRFDDEESAIEYYMSTNNEDAREVMERQNSLIFDAFNRLDKFLDNDENLEIKLLLFNNFKLEDSTLEALSTFELYPPFGAREDGKYGFYKLKYDSNEELILENHYPDDFEPISYSADIKESIGFRLFESFVQKIYQFKAERLNIGSCKLENNSELKSDISNLAEVLCILQGKQPGVFVKFNELVSIILPEIQWISVVQKEDYNVEILVWNLDPKLNRDDLSLPLSSCGSGVGQVLAILYILVSSEEPRTLIIDEPQSFLHPGAARKLIEIIKTFPQHQYFIATHSPEIITAANPSNIIKLHYENCETKASVIDATEIESQNAILYDLGVRLSDVFGADNILWVEGETEEKCFPLILEKVLNKQLRGNKILAVQHTGDFDGTKASLIFDIYDKLSGGIHLFPPAIGFLFDSEKKSEEDKKTWQERSQKPVEFLSRRMYENYLLDPDAISAVFNGENQSRREPLKIHITSENVEEWLENKKQEKEFSEEDFLYKIHGSQILQQLFSNFSQREIKFKKLKHSYELTKWLLEHKRCFLSELAAEVENML